MQFRSVGRKVRCFPCTTPGLQGQQAEDSRWAEHTPVVAAYCQERLGLSSHFQTCALSVSGCRQCASAAWDAAAAPWNSCGTAHCLLPGGRLRGTLTRIEVTVFLPRSRCTWCLPGAWHSAGDAHSPVEGTANGCLCSTPDKYRGDVSVCLSVFSGQCCLVTASLERARPLAQAGSPQGV